MIVLIGLAMGVGISFRRGGDDKEREIGYDLKRYEIRTEREQRERKKRKKERKKDKNKRERKSKI